MNLHLSDRIYAATDGGLAIFEMLLEHSQYTLAVQQRNFKLRNEKTASASLFKSVKAEFALGYRYFIKDFGTGDKALNAIEFYMAEKGCDWNTALKDLGARFGCLDEKAIKNFGVAEIAVRPAKNANEQRGYFKVETRSFTIADVRYLLARNAFNFFVSNVDKKNTKEEPENQTIVELTAEKQEALLKKFSEKMRKVGFQAVLKFEHFTDKEASENAKIKGARIVTYTASENFPIYCFSSPNTDDNGTWYKIYQPMSIDKARRFIYLGKKPSNYWFGGKVIEENYNALKAINSNYDDDDGEADEKKEAKLDSIILCTGGSDAINLLCLGYTVAWGNSESFADWFDFSRYLDFKKKAEKLYYVGDLDVTGVEAAHNLCLDYTEIHNIELPETLKLHKDDRGNACKDLRDYLKYNTKTDFEKLIKNALCYKFWVTNKSKNSISHDVSNAHLYYFLRKMGFGQYRYGNGNSTFVRIVGNVVQEIQAKDIKEFLSNYVKSLQLGDYKLYNSIIRSNQLNAPSFDNLDFFEIDFTTATANSQYLFYTNGTLEVSKAGKVFHKTGFVKRYIWEKALIKRRYKEVEVPFTIEKNQAGEWVVNWTNYETNQHLFLQYLFFSCQMFWEKREEGKELTPAEIREEELHFINRIYTAGYLLHRYKNPDKPWGVWVQENVLVEDGKSEGGTGKSIFANCFKHLCNELALGARSVEVERNPHFFENVNEQTDVVHIEDCNAYFKMGLFYPMLTGDFTINPKNKTSIVLPYNKSPKFIFTSNYSINERDGSTSRRVLYSVFGNYFHVADIDTNREHRSPRDVFGKNLFTDFNNQDWLEFDNLMAYCLQFYLLADNKIEAPMNVIDQRQLQHIIGDNAIAFFDVYFSSESGKINTFFRKLDVQTEFFTQNKTAKISPQAFKAKLKNWCKLRGYVFNPPEVSGTEARYVQTYNGVSSEMIYIQVPNAPAIAFNPDDPAAYNSVNPF